MPGIYRARLTPSARPADPERTAKPGTISLVKAPQSLTANPHRILKQRSRAILRRMFPGASQAEINAGTDVLTGSLLKVVRTGQDDYRKITSDAVRLRHILDVQERKPPR